MKFAACLISGMLFAAVPAFAADAPIEVMIIGSFHMNNPGHDMHNVKADDMLAPKRQAELAAISDGLARFKPTLVAVEWPAEKAAERYGQYRAGTLKPNRDESIQVGFRLAGKLGLERVIGIDEMTDFPYEPVMNFAKAHGQQALLDGLSQETQTEIVDPVSAMLAKDSVGATLRLMNEPGFIAKGQNFYRSMLKVGAGTEQPGVALLTAWSDRNYRICAHLVQTAKPGDRVVVVYGAGHAFLLRQCVSEMPGYKLVEPNAYLP
jgi:hypothetical protein